MEVNQHLKGRFWKVKVTYISEIDNYSERTVEYITFAENLATVGAQVECWYSDMIEDLISVNIEYLTGLDEPYELEK